MFLLCSVLYLGYTWVTHANLSVARPGKDKEGPEALMWGFLLPLKIK